MSERLGPDLVAVGSAGRRGLPHLLLASVAQYVMREVQSDVLVLQSVRTRVDDVRRSSEAYFWPQLVTFIIDAIQRSCHCLPRVRS